MRDDEDADRIIELEKWVEELMTENERLNKYDPMSFNNLDVEEFYKD